MKKIAIFQTDLSMGGIQKSLVNLLNTIDYRKYEVDLYLFNRKNFFKSIFPKEVNVKYLKPLPYVSRGIFFSILKKVKKYKINKSYDLAIDYNSYDHSCALACISADAKKHVMWVHNDVYQEYKNDSKYKLLRLFFKSKYKCFDEFVCVSKGLVKPFKELNKIKHSNFKVIPNLVLSKEIIDKSKEKVDLNVDPSKYNLVSVGRFVKQKGFDILINDMKDIIKERKDIHLYIIGAGKQKNKLKRKIKRSKLNEYVTILGAKSNPYKYENLMDGFVLESRYEGQGIVFLEAKVLGLDLIIPDSLKEYISDVPYTKDVKKAIINIKKKKNKKFDKLEKYNEDIISSINELFSNI